MNLFDNDIIIGILKTQENEKLEFKEIFDRGSKAAKAKYAKELAAMYNFKGGYLIFGVADKTNELVGLTDFTEPDSAEIADDLNEYFKPVFAFRQKTFSVNGKTLFIIHVSGREDIPAVCVRTFPEVIYEGTIYFKYSSQSAPIHGEDLIHLMMSLKSQDNKKLADLEAKKSTIEFRPNIERGISGLKDGAIVFKFTNKGKRFKIISIGTGHLDFQAAFFKQPPFFLEPNEVQMAVKVWCNSGCNMAAQKFTVQFIVENELGEVYAINIEGNGGSVKFLEPEMI